MLLCVLAISEFDCIESGAISGFDGIESGATEMHFLRSVKGYTRPDKIRSEVIRKELEISGIQDVKSKYKTGSTISK